MNPKVKNALALLGLTEVSPIFEKIITSGEYALSFIIVAEHERIYCFSVSRQLTPTLAVACDSKCWPTYRKEIAGVVIHLATGRKVAGFIEKDRKITVMERNKENGI